MRRSPFVLLLAVALCVPSGALAASQTSSGWASEHPRTFEELRLRSLQPMTNRAPWRRGGDRVFSGDVAMPTGFEVPAGARWSFDPNVSTTVEVAANVVVRGVLEMRPTSPGVVHTLRFTDVDETTFRGGGHQVLASDVGLWVMDAGRLDIAGSPKEAWMHAESVAAGAHTVTLASDPAGWLVGDELVLTPTVTPTYPDHHRAYDERSAAAITGRQVRLDRATTHPHPAVEVAPGRSARPEILNLTRNVRIEGTRDGRAHVFIHSTSPQRIEYAQLRHLGPRKPNPEYAHLTDREPATLKVAGRYGLHFHHSGDGSWGSVVRGVVARDLGNHAFVPHMSHGITFSDDIAHGVMETPFWWDPRPHPEPGDPTNAVMFERNVASKVTADPLDPDGTTLAGFWIGRGGPPDFAAADQNIARGNVAVGIDGGSRSSGYIWPENSEGMWVFEDNVTHNGSHHGLFVWHVTSHPHHIERFTSFHNGEHGVFHGAYGNRYRYTGMASYGNKLSQGLWWGVVACDASRAECEEEPVALADSHLNGAGISPYALILAGRGIPAPERFGRIERNTFTGYTQRAVNITFDFHDFGPNPARWRLSDNTYGAPGTSDDLWVSDTVHADTVVGVDDDVHGSVTLRRKDQPGTLHQEWNGRVR